jgi:predicted metalloprotease with PDZ domain
VDVNLLPQTCLSKRFGLSVVEILVKPAVWEPPMTIIKTGIILSSARVLLLFFLLAFPCAADTANSSDEIIGSTQGYFFLKAHGTSLKAVASIVQKKYSVEIKGLEALENQKITFVYEAFSLEELLKGLLRYLNIKNFAFEFADQQLKTVTVVPEAKNQLSNQIESPLNDTKRSETVAVVVIKSVVESSQAESLGLLEGDLIVEYDGMRINSANQLVKEVEKKSAKKQIEILVVREKRPMRLILQGGMIGVRITSEKIPKEAYNTFF